MNGLDVLVFTAGVGENSVLLRKTVCNQLSFFGVELDDGLNQIRSSEERRISANHSKIQVLVIPTNEELMIARETYRLVANKNPEE
jgi:acetate kinase